MILFLILHSNKSLAIPRTFPPFLYSMNILVYSYQVRHRRVWRAGRHITPPPPPPPRGNMGKDSGKLWPTLGETQQGVRTFHFIFLSIFRAGRALHKTRRKHLTSLYKWGSKRPTANSIVLDATLMLWLSCLYLSISRNKFLPGTNTWVEKTIVHQNLSRGHTRRAGIANPSGSATALRVEE